MITTNKRPSYGGEKWICLLILPILVLTVGCSLQESLDTLVGMDPWQNTSSESASTEAETLAMMTFTVKVPENTPGDEPILISILDEVTGLALNAQRYSMEPTRGGEYTIDLPFVPGSTIKYRYSRRGSVLAEEHTTDGRPVRYRMVYVGSPGEVVDVISRWNDTPFVGATGRISGTVMSAASGNPVPGMLVAAGGAQAITASDGGFLIEGLPPGTHQLVAYAQNGAYQTFQHGASVAAESTTPAPIQIVPNPKVDITFILHVPEDTPPIVPIRLAGNLIQLGNTFADLSGGVSTLASRMPVLSALPDGTYGVILGLPAGAHIQYKYSLGDGFWNAEREDNGDVVLRELIVPDQPTLIEETVLTWHAGNTAPITFDLTVPGSTPVDESISIQFNPYGWTEPIPMWHLGDSRWAYILYNPLDQITDLGYRYCRAGQCGQADDSRTPGPLTAGLKISPGKDPVGLADEVPSWSWLEKGVSNPIDLDTIPTEVIFDSDFMAGIEFDANYHPSWLPHIQAAMAKISSDGANWVVLTPSWSFTRQNPPVLEPVTGADPMWLESVEMIAHAQNNDLQVALRPVPHFPTTADEWWASAPRDFPWWVSFFDRYRAFTIHYAQLAERAGIQTLILGGDWISPALPAATLVDGNPSGVPLDANDRYRELITEIREHFSGTIGWAFTYPDDLLDPPGFNDDIDLVNA